MSQRPAEHTPGRAREEHAPPGFFGTLREMAWAFFGVRDRHNYERTTRANPLHIIAAGVLLTAGLILGLLVIVHFAVGAAAR